MPPMSSSHSLAQSLPPSPLPLVTDLLSSPPSAVTVNPDCSAAVHEIRNEHFQGRLMLKLRPPHGPPQQQPSKQQDNLPCPSPAGGAGSCECCAAFFSRYPAVQLELAVQGRFLQPVSRVWMGAELGGSPSAFTLTLPFIKRTLIKVMAGIIATFIPKVKWTLGDKRVSEYPLIAFPFVSAMDCVLSTPLASTDPPPAVGWQRLPMTAGHRSALSFDSEFDAAHLYTFAFYSDQLDLARWKAVNVPGVSEIDLQSVWLHHPLTLLAYTLVDKDGAHSHSNRRTLFAIRLQNPNQQQQAAQQQQQDYEGPHVEKKESGSIPN